MSHFFGLLMALLYCTVRFRRNTVSTMAIGADWPRWRNAHGYEGWFLIPFAALYFLFAAKRRGY